MRPPRRRSPSRLFPFVPTHPEREARRASLRRWSCWLVFEVRVAKHAIVTLSAWSVRRRPDGWRSSDARTSRTHEGPPASLPGGPSRAISRWLPRLAKMRTLLAAAAGACQLAFLALQDRRE
jgi:hypothetical protein